MPRRTNHVRHLIGDGVENPRNARAMLDAGSMFGVPVGFRDRADLAARWDLGKGGAPLTFVDTGALLGLDHPALVAIENTPRSRTIFDTSLRGPSSVVVGNERRGIARDLIVGAADVVHIPMTGRRTDTLNVAAAAAVALYFLQRDRKGNVRTVPNPERRRPALCLLAPTDHVECGSVLRSAAAVGWRSVHVADRHHVWFDTPRPTRTEGRAAARSHRNDLRVLRFLDRQGGRFKEVVVAASGLDGPPLSQGRLGVGPDSVLVLPDERGVDLDAEDWERLGSRVRFVNLDLPQRSFSYRYRLTATIALVEAARQIGTPSKGPRAGRPKGLRYDSTIDLGVVQETDAVSWQELAEY